MTLYDEFIHIAKAMNKELNIVPVLYGSLGLERATTYEFNPQDIDILVPFTFLDKKWHMLLKTIEELGYVMVDINEHEFRRDDTKIGISFTEDLEQFAEIEYEALQIVEDNGAKYHSLTISDYLKVYNKSLVDGYRRSKNNKDHSKIKILKQLVQK